MFGRTFFRSPLYRRTPDFGGFIDLAVSVSGTGAVTSLAGLVPELALVAAGSGAVAADTGPTRAIEVSVAGVGELLADNNTSSGFIYTAGGVSGSMFFRSPRVLRLVPSAPNALGVEIAGAGTVAAALEQPDVDLTVAVAGRGSLEQTVPPLPYNVVGPDLVVSRALLAAVSGQATLTPRLNLSEVLQLAIAGTGTVAADILTRIEYAVEVAGTSAVTADATIVRGLETTIAGSGELTAALLETLAFAVAVNGTAVVTVNLSTGAITIRLRTLMGVGT